MKKVETFTARIYLGLKEGYNGRVRGFDEVRKCLEEYVKVNPFCFTLEHTIFIHTDGTEPGAVIGIINYPRFPRTRPELKKIALKVAEDLRVLFVQNRVSVVFTDETVMLGDE